MPYGEMEAVRSLNLVCEKMIDTTLKLFFFLNTSMNSTASKLDKAEREAHYVL